MFLAWIAENKAVRQRHGILFELVLHDGSPSEAYTVLTAWPSHEVFDAWIATPERNALTESDVHQSVAFQPIARLARVGGYFNLPALEQEQRT